MPEERDGHKDGSKYRRILVVSYDEANSEVEHVDTITDAINWIGKRKVTWIVMTGRPEWKDLTVLRERLGVHPVMMEELSEEAPLRPKLIDYQELILVSWKILRLREERILETRVISLLGRGFLFTVAPPEFDYDKIIEKLHSEHNVISTLGVDFLLYDIIDTTIDEYFKVSEILGDLVEQTQDRILRQEGREAVLAVQRLRRSIIRLRKAIWPLREAVNSLVKGQSDLVDDYTAPYFRDVYDHTIELMDTVDTHRDMLSEMLDLYQSEVSNQLNRVVKVLTIIAVIFSPLTFFTSIFSMNFKYTPPFDVTWGYPMVILSCLIIAVIMLVIFKRKQWF
jgi:magnesium transporter